MKQKTPWFRITCMLLFLVWIGLFLVVPHLFHLFNSLFRDRDTEFHLTLVNYTRFFTDSLYWKVYLRTALYSIATTFFTLLMMFPVAFYLAKVAKGRLQIALLLIMIMPFYISELVRTYSWMTMLRETGILNWMLVNLGLLEEPIEMLYNDYVIFIGLVYSSMLYMLFSIYSVLEGLDDALIEAAMDLGATRRSIFWEIILPYSLPGVTSGCIIVFMLSVGSYVVPTLMGGKNSLYFTETIYNQFIVSNNWNQGSAFGFLLLFLSSLCVWLGLRLSKQKFTGVVQ